MRGNERWRRHDCSVVGVNLWWHDDERERYFLETTGRTDIGVDLHAPQVDDRGRKTAAYSLIEYVREGDVVFHYQMPHGIVGWSRVEGAPFEDNIIWGARGKAAQLSGVLPYARPGWRVSLSGPYPLRTVVDLGELREHEVAVKRAVEQTERLVDGTIYRPFQLSDKQSLRATQSYLTKLPRAVLQAVPELREAVADETRTRSMHPAEMAPAPGRSVGRDYAVAEESVSSGAREPFDVDPGIVDRGVEGHARTQNLLARTVAARGLDPLSPLPGEPQYDLAWRGVGGLHVAEVKSLTEANEEKQLRLGLGQVLRYRHLMAVNEEEVTAVLAVEREPRDPSWAELCGSLGVTLCWAPRFTALDP